MYFFDIIDYYYNCYFGSFAVTATESAQNITDHHVTTPDTGVAVTSAFLKTVSEFVGSARCENDTACTTSDQAVIDEYIDFQIEFLKQQSIFFNAYQNPTFWGFVDPTITPLIGIHTVTLNKYLIPSTFNSSLPIITPTPISVSIDYGNAIINETMLENYKSAYKNFECSVRKLISYFTGAKFEHPELTNFQKIIFPGIISIGYYCFGDIIPGVPIAPDVEFWISAAGGTGGYHPEIQVPSTNYPTLILTLPAGYYPTHERAVLKFNLSGIVPAGSTAPVIFDFNNQFQVYSNQIHSVFIPYTPF